MKLHSMLVICALSGLIIIFYFTAWSFTQCWLFTPFQGLLLFFILPHGASLHAGYLRPFRANYYFSFYSMELHSMLVIYALSGLIIIFHFTAWSFTPCWLFMLFQYLLLFH
ncbi:MAG TPA: hypothetical protein VJ455_02340 [Ignavibacteria bacterium]|nr:hypothetical protein [Ignavibacteria bacterium]